MSTSRPRVLFLGLNNRFSTAVLNHLLDAGVDICGVVLSATGASGLATQESLSPLPLLNPFPEAPLLNIAHAHGRPAFALTQPDDPQALARAATLAPDIGCVACFDRRLPPAWLAIPSAGFFNLHPSPLPKNRGPAPLFWSFRSGVTETAVTLHQMDAGLDSGPIAGQAPLALPIGSDGVSADARAAAAGAALFVELMGQLVAGTHPLHPQPSGGSYRPWPRPADFALDPGWPAARAYHFMRGTADWEQPYLYDGRGDQVWLATAVDFDGRAQAARASRHLGGLVELPFTPGVLRATPAT